MPPAQPTTPLMRFRNEGQLKQTRKATSVFATGQFTLSFFMRDISFGLAPPLSCSVTTLGTFFGFVGAKTGT
ncbi:MAG: hypothetical protein LYZ70_07430 [Nitrososphaerales archaeon]|nr:hypothetical protein [Nitrososphaerales archaeon]